MKVAVVGHVEWIRFARVKRLPGPGEIAHSTDDWDQAGGGGGVAAIQLALLADEAHLFTALGDDELGRRSRGELEERGVDVHAAPDPRPQRWAFVHVDEVGERTITTVGRKLRPLGSDDRLPWLDLAGMDAVLFIAGDVEALRFARRAPVLTATARDLDILRRGGVALDVLIGSGEDEAERYHAGDLDPEPDLVVTTSGARSGVGMQPGGPGTTRCRPRPARGHVRLRRLVHGRTDVCARRGCEPHDAVAFAARCGAAALTGRGVAPQSVAL